MTDLTRQPADTTPHEVAGYPDGIGKFVAEELARVAQFPSDVAFDTGEYDARRTRLRSAMADANIDVLIVTAPEGSAWLHGFTSRVYEWQASTYFPPSAATVVTAENDTMFYVDSALHTDLIRRTSVVSDFRPVPESTLTTNTTGKAYVDFIVEQLRSEGWHRVRVGMELWSGIPNPAVMQLYRDALTDAGYTVVDATDVIRRVRRVKSPAELDRIMRAQHAVDSGIRAVQAQVEPGMTEYEAHGIYLRGVMEGGGEQSAIHDTVYAGPPESFGHEVSSRRYRFDRNDYIHVDGAAASAGYHARACRVLTFGKPRSELQRLNDICAGALEVLTVVPEAGMPFSELDHALEDYFRKADVGEGIGFVGGYELGISMGADYVGEFVWGSTLPERGGVIEAGLVTNVESLSFIALIDTVLFEQKGARTLSELPRDILQVEAPDERG
ncbi:MULTISPECIES: M24 family metallopeptidase [unclassified Microbacterium]|uniref:M24 family metallopeptidase n=1 Tax=unclassified Microbacterium TaxID=2609290 RepID=UPI0004938F1A|nr:MULTISPECIES: M24 family metallopeptidase [unclassified Microbacterium]